MRRPRPLHPSPPLDDNFDAITQEHTRSLDKDTTSPYTSVMPQDFEAAISHSEWTEGRWKNPAHRSGNALNEGHDQAGASGRRNTHSNAHGFDDSGQYKQYMDEMERMFGESLDLKVSVRRWGPGESSSDRFNSGEGKSRTAPAGMPGRPGPPPGQEYEIIHRRIIEDGPEKTVTISTWREQVAQHASNEVEMSVYYVGADDHGVASELDERGKPGPAGSKSSSDSSKSIGQRKGIQNAGAWRSNSSVTSIYRLKYSED